MTKSFTGIVASSKADKTITVIISRRKTHPLYKKQYSASNKLIAHDEKNEAGSGDRVVIEETRPISRHKHFKLVKIVEKAPVKHIEKQDAVIAEVTGQTKKEEEKPEESKE